MTPRCPVFWGTHGCKYAQGHAPEFPHVCDCCVCIRHPDPGSSCVGAPPYYGPDTIFHNGAGQTWTHHEQGDFG